MTKSVIQEDLIVEGDLVAKEGVISIGGKVTGDIEASSVEILSGGHVKGALNAKDVAIAGSLEGTVKCGALSLDEKSQLRADVTAKTMTMSSGAKISGRIEAEGG